MPSLIFKLPVCNGVSSANEESLHLLLWVVYAYLLQMYVMSHKLPAVECQLQFAMYDGVLTEHTRTCSMRTGHKALGTPRLDTQELVLLSFFEALFCLQCFRLILLSSYAFT